MTFVFPSVNGTVKPKERSGHVAVHYDGYIVVWGGYNRVRTYNLHKDITLGSGLCYYENISFDVEFLKTIALFFQFSKSLVIK